MLLYCQSCFFHAYSQLATHCINSASYIPACGLVQHPASAECLVLYSCDVFEGQQWCSSPALHHKYEWTHAVFVPSHCVKLMALRPCKQNEPQTKGYTYALHSLSVGQLDAPRA